MGIHCGILFHAFNIFQNQNVLKKIPTSKIIMSLCLTVGPKERTGRRTLGFQALVWWLLPSAETENLEGSKGGFRRRRVREKRWQIWLFVFNCSSAFLSSHVWFQGATDIELGHPVGSWSGAQEEGLRRAEVVLKPWEGMGSALRCV